MPSIIQDRQLLCFCDMMSFKDFKVRGRSVEPKSTIVESQHRTMLMLSNLIGITFLTRFLTNLDRNNAPHSTLGLVTVHKGVNLDFKHISLVVMAHIWFIYILYLLRKNRLVHWNETHSKVKLLISILIRSWKAFFSFGSIHRAIRFLSSYKQFLNDDGGFMALWNMRKILVQCREIWFFYCWSSRFRTFYG
jgi:hypothetical protein